MSVIVPVQSLTLKQREAILKDLEIAPRETKFTPKYGNKGGVLAFKMIHGSAPRVKIPFAYYHHFLSPPGSFPNDHIKHPRSSGYKFTGSLNANQEDVKEETIIHLNQNRSVLIALACGMGKTIYTIYLASRLQYKTLVWCPRIVLIHQWVHSIKKVCPGATVQILQVQTKLDPDADFYIMNVANMSKRSSDDFKHIGLLVSDEAHTLCSESYSQAVFHIQPRYFIALTATPDRSDGMDKLLEYFVGPCRITRKLWRPFNVYTLSTGFRPKMEKTAQGNLDWNSVLESQTTDPKRNSLIIKIIRYFWNRNILVLCKRVEQSKILRDKLKELKEDVDMFVSTAQTFDYDCRVLISTFSKTGVGFDHSKLDMLILGSDVELNITQYIGRVFRRPDVVPIIIDLLDESHILKKHFQSRRELYEKFGGRIKSLSECFPEFL